MELESNILNRKHPVSPIYDEKKIKEINAHQKERNFENPKWPPAAILKTRGSQPPRFY